MIKETNNSYDYNYLIERDPNRFGGKQEEYIQETKLIINNFEKSISECIKSEKSLTELFYNKLKEFGEKRQEIAIKQNVIQSEDARFGVLRTEKCDFMNTPLAEPYSEYNARLLGDIQKQLLEKKQKKEFPAVLDRSSSIEYSILKNNESDQWEYQFHSYESYKKLCATLSLPPESIEVANNHLASIFQDKELIRTLKTKDLKTYIKLKNAINVRFLKSTIEDQKRDWSSNVWILFTLRAQVNNKMYGLTQYITWTEPHTHSNFSDLTPKGNKWDRTVVLLHQDPYLVDDMLKEISLLFKQAIETNKGDLKVLKERVALFDYLLGHTMPYERGTAAIAEWFEKSIYGYHGFDLSYVKGKMVNLEALTLPLKTFIDTYDTTVEVTPRNK
jgi:hypothetical protein